jgi:hypothetical protein
MNTKKVAMASGAVVLAMAGVLAGRASAKFTTAPSLYVSSSAGCLLLKSPSSLIQFSQSATGNATIRTANGVNSRHIYYTSTCNSTAATKAWVNFKP